MSRREEINQILKQVEGWPRENRETLAIELLDFSPKTSRPQLRVEDLVGLARGESDIPTDAHVAQWIDEHRTEKYGR